MSKNTQNAASAPMFKEGDRVAVTTAATNNLPLTGTIGGITKTGWYVVRLDEALDHPSCKDGKVSARASSLSWAANEAAIADIVGDEIDYCVRCHMGPVVVNEEGACASCAEEGDEEAKGISKMAQALQQARPRYAKTHRPDGTPSADCADAIAKELREYEPLDVCKLADHVLNVAVGTHLGKYGHLNNGQIRMNSGNRIRAYWKSINEDGDEQEIARVAGLLGLEIGDEEEESDEE